jgi:copper chaperone CopZ
MKKIFQVEGMHCPSCAAIIESDLENIGIKSKCSYAKQTLEVKDFDSSKIHEIRKSVIKSGYRIEG